MDHVPLPLTSNVKHLDVPLVACKEYDLLGFDNFWKRCGFEDTLKRFDLDRPSADCAALIQSWLYLGVLSEALDRPVSIAEVTQPGEPPMLRVGTLVHEAIVHCVKAREQGKKAWYEKRSIVMNVLERATAWGEFFSNQAFASSEPVPVVLLSVNVLLCAIKNMLIAPHFTVDADPRLVLRPPGTVLTPAGRLMRDRLIKMKYCPQQAHRLCSEFEGDVAYFASLVQRRQKPYFSHVNCTEHQCVASDTDENDYEVRHVFDGCSCSMIEISEKDLLKILEDGGIPTVAAHINRRGLPELRVRAATHREPYVAVSHVWKDGIGNPTRNALPTCQIQRIASFVNELPDPGKSGTRYVERKDGIQLGALADSRVKPQILAKERFFWIDTLCIPVRPQYADLRAKAINKMAAIYAGASHVLALDSELQGIMYGEASRAEIFAYIMASAWSSRSWTLQEGALAREASFRFANGALNPIGWGNGETLFQDLNSGGLMSHISTRYIFTLVRIYLTDRFKEMRQVMRGRRKDRFEYRVESGSFSHDVTLATMADKLLPYLKRELYYDRKSSTGIRTFEGGQLNPRGRAAALVTTWNALISRNTLKKDDLYLMLANLLDYNSYQVSLLPSKEKQMKAMFWSTGLLPLSLLYTRSPKVKEGEHHKDRWLPSEVYGDPFDGGPLMTCETSEEVDESYLRLDTAYQAQKDIRSLVMPSSGVFGSEILIGAGTSRVYRITADRVDDDILTEDAGTFIGTCFIIERTATMGPVHPGITVRGACLRIVRAEVISDEVDTTDETQPLLSDVASPTPRVSLKVIYDCPVSVEAIRRGDLTPDQQARVETGSQHDKYDLRIECEHFPRSELLHPRPYPLAFIYNPIAYTITVLSTMFLIVLMVLTYFVILRDEPRPLTPSYLASAYIFISGTALAFIGHLLTAAWALLCRHLLYAVPRHRPALYVAASTLATAALAAAFMLTYLGLYAQFLGSLLAIVAWFALAPTAALTRYKVGFLLLGAVQLALPTFSARIWNWRWNKRMWDMWLASFDEGWDTDAAGWWGWFDFFPWVPRARARFEADWLVAGPWLRERWWGRGIAWARWRFGREGMM